MACRKFKRFPWIFSLLVNAGWRRIIYVPKGAPETFDVDKLAENLRLVRADRPQYDRQRHDPAGNAMLLRSRRRS